MYFFRESVDSLCRHDMDMPIRYIAYCVFGMVFYPKTIPALLYNGLSESGMEIGKTVILSSSSYVNDLQLDWYRSKDHEYLTNLLCSPISRALS